jgi:hypothetical protein
MTLIETLRRMPVPLFAVLDGAIVENAKDILAAVELSSRALYAGEFEDVGIHLVTLHDEAEVDAFLSLLPADLPAVFWSWREGEDQLYRHLRRLGKVEVPKSGTDPDDPEFDAVVFRHADPASLMKVLPVLTQDQRAAFFGPARGIVLQNRTPRGSEIVRMASDGRLSRDPVTGDGATAIPAATGSA